MKEPSLRNQTKVSSNDSGGSQILFRKFPKTVEIGHFRFEIVHFGSKSGIIGSKSVIFGSKSGIFGFKGVFSVRNRSFFG